MKKLAKFLAVLFAAYWLFLAHVSLNFLERTQSLSEVSKNGKYKALLKNMYPANPIGLYCFLTTESSIYFVLYDMKNNYIGQSSPFACYGKWSDAYYLFPDENLTTDVNSFIVVDVNNNGELNISTKDKRWWSWWFGLFY